MGDLPNRCVQLNCRFFLRFARLRYHSQHAISTCRARNRCPGRQQTAPSSRRQLTGRSRFGDRRHAFFAHVGWPFSCHLLHATLKAALCESVCRSAGPCPEPFTIFCCLWLSVQIACTRLWAAARGLHNALRQLGTADECPQDGFRGRRYAGHPCHNRRCPSFARPVGQKPCIFQGLGTQGCGSGLFLVLKQS